MKLRNLVAIAFLACLPAGAQAGLMVMASGDTIGDQGIENASVSILGGDPSIVAIQSFQNGNVGAVHLEANLLGSGVATYGTLAASLQAQARNQATFPNLYEPSAFGILRISFEDGGTVASDTLPLGTPVVLTFVAFLGSDFIATGRGADPSHNGAAVDFDARVEDTTTGLFASGFIGNGVAGSTPPSVTFSLATEVGRALQLTGELDLGVEARALNMDGGDVLATTSIVADQTAHLTYQPLGDVRLVSDSGHDYTISAPVPEPGSLGFALAGLGIAAMLLRCRRQTSRNA